MSVGDPLGATPRSGAYELRTQVIDARVGVASGRAGTLGVIGLGGLLITGFAIALSAANTDTLLPETARPVPGYLAGPFGTSGPDIGNAGLISALVLMFVAYVVTMRSVHALSPRAVLAAIAGLNALILLAPPLLSTDVFSYQAYARMGTTYGANPYLLGPHVMALDPLYPFVGARWVTTPTAYGPLFTLLSYPLAGLDISASVIAYKLIAVASCLVVVAAVWNVARIRGLDPVRAAALVGLNPLLVVYGVGGGHNDLIMLAVMMAGVYLLVAHRDRAGAGTIVASAGIKLTAALMLPFAIAGHARLRPRGRRDALVGAAMVIVAMSASTALLFGTGSLHVVTTLQKNQALGDWHSIPGFISTRLGLGEIGHATGYLLGAGFLAVFGWLVLRVHRHRLDWIAGAGWATLAMLATASSLLPWYVAWLLPLAAIGGDARLYRAAITFTGVILGITLMGYIPHASTLLGL